MISPPRNRDWFYYSPGHLKKIDVRKKNGRLGRPFFLRTILNNS